MNVVVVLDFRFNQTPDGQVWTETTFAYPFWCRYLARFDAVKVVARVRRVARAAACWSPASGEHVSFVPVPDYSGIAHYFFTLRQVRQTVHATMTPGDAVILRIPSQLGTLMADYVRKLGHPYGVEVVQDPYDLFARGAFSHPLRPLLRTWLTWQLKRQCRNAAVAAYVTDTALQRRYPCPGYALGVSDVELPPVALRSTPRHYAESPPRPLLVSVAMLNREYKGMSVLIEAVAHCVHGDVPLQLRIIGEGACRPALEARVKQLGLTNHIRFLGQLPAGEAIRDQLDQADLFVLPSFAEGLPRAMIEAMARALPCIGSTAGGIPELLPPAALVEPGNVAALTNKIRSALDDPLWMTQMSARNLRRAHDYSEDHLRGPREAFYEQVRRATEAYVATG